MNGIFVVLIAGLVCGVLDSISAMIVSAFFGAKPIRVFQRIASGVLGHGAFERGASAAALGVALHFTIALGAATVYFAASRVLPFLIHHAILSGVLYGIAVHFFMTFVVIPLSAIGKRPLAPKFFLAMVGVHMMVVGPSISFTIRYLLGP